MPKDGILRASRLENMWQFGEMESLEQVGELHTMQAPDTSPKPCPVLLFYLAILRGVLL